MQFGPYPFESNDYLDLSHFKVILDQKITHITGKNGTGKTTLMRKMIRECQQLNINFSYLSQNYRENWLWWYSARQNIQLRLDILKLPKLENLSQYNQNQLWLQPLLDKAAPQTNLKYQSEVDSTGLSGGQLQKVILFRELLSQPEIVFFDETFSAMDPETVSDLCDWIKDLQEQHSFQIVNITHSAEITKYLPGIIIDLKQNFATKEIYV